MLALVANINIGIGNSRITSKTIATTQFFGFKSLKSIELETQSTIKTTKILPE